MKIKPFLLLVIFLYAFEAPAQKLAIWQGNKEVTNSRQVLTVKPGEKLEKTLLIENKTKEHLEVWLQKTSLIDNKTTRSDIFGTAFRTKTNEFALAPLKELPTQIEFLAGQNQDDKKVLYTVFAKSSKGLVDSVSVLIEYRIEASQGFSYEDLKMDLYPNPVVTELSVELKDFTETCDLIIYNNIGQQVRKMHISDARKITRISVSDFNSGLYFASVVKDDEILLTKRFLVNH